MKVLIVDGYFPHPDSKGQLTRDLVKIFGELFTNRGDEVKYSNTRAFNQTEEENKIIWCDILIIQFPVYWYQVPSGLKRYFDDVLSEGVAYKSVSNYGTGPLLSGKQYLISTTWAAPDSIYEQGQFLDGFTLDDILLPLDLTMKYCGLTKIAGGPIGFYDVFDNTDENQYKLKIKRVIDKIDL